MYIFVLVVHIIVSLMLVAVILLQAGRGGGLADTFGGGAGSQTTIFVQKTTDHHTKATTVSAVLFLCTSLTLAFISSKRQKSLMRGIKVMPQEDPLPLKQAAGAAEKEATATVKEVKIDPKTGKETVVEQKTIPAEKAD
jgi:preprotein translocase subunit SecG